MRRNRYKNGSTGMIRLGEGVKQDNGVSIKWLPYKNWTSNTKYKKLREFAPLSVCLYLCVCFGASKCRKILILRKRKS